MNAALNIYLNTSPHGVCVLRLGNPMPAFPPSPALLSAYQNSSHGNTWSYPLMYGALAENLEMAHAITWQQLPIQRTNLCGSMVGHYASTHLRRTKFSCPGPPGLHLAGACGLQRTARTMTSVIFQTRDLLSVKAPKLLAGVTQPCLWRRSHGDPESSQPSAKLGGALK